MEDKVAQHLAEEMAAIIGSQAIKISKLITTIEDLQNKNAQLNLQISELRKEGKNDTKH